ncbi:MAG: hypothetical protein QOG67_2910 [Verrucomicrobiota bacterium]
MLSATATETASKPLRILIVLNLEWNSQLGAARIYMELAEQWRSAGHAVEHFSLADAFPVGRTSSRRLALRLLLFPYRAAAFVRKNAGRFDIVDALAGALPMSKKKLNFTGLLVARSVGWHQTYDRFERTASRRWPRRAPGTFLGKWIYSLIRHLMLRRCDSSVRLSDLVNLPNEEEAGDLRREIGVRPFLVQPYGLTAQDRHGFAQVARSPAMRLGQKTISFIGMWALRKGAGDWGQIARSVRRQVPDARFRFLGTMVEADKVLADLGGESTDGIEVISEFSPAELPGLLADCTVGALPSYVEGFGLALLEQLAAGIPTVAFEAAGPRDILRSRLPELLVPNGDVEAFAAALIKILQLDLPAYETLVQASIRAAGDFFWPTIAEETLRSYREALVKTSER